MKKEVKAMVQEVVGVTFSPAIFDRAYAKAKRWDNKAGADTFSDATEAARLVGFFYHETLKEPDGRKTFNRGY